MRVALRLLAVAPAAALFAWLTVEAIAAARVEETLAGLDRKLRAGPAQSGRNTAELEALGDALRRTRSLQPRNPAVHELMGLAAVRAPGGGEQGAAADHFARALSLRPVSAATWANLVEARYLAGAPAMALEVPLATAVRLGASNPGVQRVVALYGLAVWDEVSAATRAEIDRAVGAGMRRNPLEILQIAGRRDRLPVACRHLEGSPRRPDPQWSRLCQSREAT